MTPLSETLGAMTGAGRRGQGALVGISNVNAGEIEEADALARQEDWAPIVSVQNEYNLLNRHIEADVLPVCQRLGIGILPYFPLASGLLSGKYRRGRGAARRHPALGSSRDRNRTAQFEQIEGLTAFAAARGLTMRRRRDRRAAEPRPR